MIIFDNPISPLSIAFAVIIVGYYIGKIKFFGISLNLAGVLIVAVVGGWILTVINPIKEYLFTSDFQMNMKFFSSFGTALFVSIIGLTTGYSLNLKRWKDIKAAAIGSLMVVSAFLTMKLIAVFDTDISTSKLLGCLCGALTTTPGLSAACELKSIVAEEATLGYGCAYLFGVIFTVLYVQITTRKTCDIPDDKMCIEKNDSKKASFDTLVQISLIILIGYLLGNIKLFDFSLGNSGGMLCVGIVIGGIIRKWLPQNITHKEPLNLLRNLGLVLFFVGNGIPAGMQLNYGFEVKTVLYGAVMTIIPILIGVLLYKIMFTAGLSATVVAGGMTSTPAIGVLMRRNKNILLSQYSLAYVGALITIILLLRSL